ncbi:MAG: hypothetical protein VB934_06350 [Polyangiaceae bacterium]
MGLAQQARSAADAFSGAAVLRALKLGRSLSALQEEARPRTLPPSKNAERIARLSGRDLQPAAPANADPSAAPRAAKAPQLATHSDEPPSRKAPKPVGVLIRRARVLAAANAGIRPSGVPVPSTSYRPAGLALVGVSAIGVGLRDGDVLTRAGGTPARSDGAVVAAVTVALRRGDPAITADVWRGPRRLIVTVQLPKLVEKKVRQSAPLKTKAAPMPATMSKTNTSLTAP